MRDVNGSTFVLLADPSDWGVTQGVAWNGAAYALAGKQVWRLPAGMTRLAAMVALAATSPMVLDGYGGIARISADGSAIESQDGASWVPLTDIDGTQLAPKVGRFIRMALGGARLALLASDGTNSFLELFDLRGRWGLDTPENPAVALTLDPTGTGVAVAADGPIHVLVQGGLAIFEGGPIQEFVAIDHSRFAPIAANPDPLRRTALFGNRPAGAALAMAVDPTRVAILLDQGNLAQTLALLDRASGNWSTTPVTAIDHTSLPYMTDVGLLSDGLVALMAPATRAGAPLDCAVVTPAPPQGVTLAPYRYPMLSQSAPRFAAIPGPDVYYLNATGPRQLLPLPYPAYLTVGALGGFGLNGNDPDRVWHRLYAEADLPPGTSLAVWARASEQPWFVAPATDAVKQLTAEDQAAMVATILYAPPGTTRIDAAAAAKIATAHPANVPALTTSLSASLNAAPFHLQPPPVAALLPSELPFHPGLAALAGMPGALYELLLQRTGGANRRLAGSYLDLVVVASGDGRHSPCLRAVRVYAPRFCYQDEYLPALFHQTSLSDEADQTTPSSAPDFRERLFANLEGMLTPLENRVASAEYLLDPYATPADMLPWLGSYLGRTLDPGWPEARRRRALASAGQQLRQRGTYRGVCLALDIATDGAVARGEVVLLETHRLRRTNATVLGLPMGGRNIMTGDGVPSGNSIVGDTLILSAERAIEVLALLAPSLAAGADAATVAQFLDEYADRIQVSAILQGPSAIALQPVVTAVLQAELPAQLQFEIVLAANRFILGLSPLLDIDTFLDPPVAPAPLTLDQSVIGRDAVLRDPAVLRQ
jgi:phage tail-like protein